MIGQPPRPPVLTPQAKSRTFPPAKLAHPPDLILFNERNRTSQLNDDQGLHRPNSQDGIPGMFRFSPLAFSDGQFVCNQLKLPRLHGVLTWLSRLPSAPLNSRAPSAPSTFPFEPSPICRVIRFEATPTTTERPIAEAMAALDLDNVTNSWTQLLEPASLPWLHRPERFPNVSVAGCCIDVQVWNHDESSTRVPSVPPNFERAWTVNNYI